MTGTGGRVAVAIPVYNAEDWIERTVRSVLDTAPQARVIAVDDGSSDGSLDRLRGFGDRIRVETGPNRGACHARNRGLAIAQAEGADYILFLDADDYVIGPMIPGALAVAEARGADLVLSDMHLEYADGRRIERPLYAGDIAPETFFTGWLDGDYVNPSALLWRVAFMRRLGGWDETLARAQDFDLVFRALLAEPVIAKNEAGAAIHTQLNPASISRSQSRDALTSRFRAVSGLFERTQGTRFAPLAPRFFPELYMIARAAFRAGYTDLGRETVDFLHRQGCRSHFGTLPHRIAASVIGLERKVRLWGD